MARVARAQMEARQRAREGMARLNEGRAARDRRIEDAAAAVYAASRDREAALRVVAEADERAAAGLRSVLAEEVRLEEAALLCGLAAGEAQRLLRSSGRDREAVPTGSSAGAVRSTAPAR